MRRALTVFMAALAVAGFVVSLIVHIATYTGPRMEPGGWLNLLHFLFIPPFIMLVYLLQKDGKIQRAKFIPDNPEQQKNADKNGLPNYKQRGRFETSTIFPYGLPYWAVVFLKLLAINLLVQVVFFAFLYKQRPEPNGNTAAGYFVRDKEGRHEVSEDEYHMLRTKELRGYSGIWLIAYAVPALALGSFMAGKKSGTVGGIADTFSGGKEPIDPRDGHA